MVSNPSPQHERVEQHGVTVNGKVEWVCVRPQDPVAVVIGIRELGVEVRRHVAEPERGVDPEGVCVWGQAR